MVEAHPALAPRKRRALLLGPGASVTIYRCPCDCHDSGIEGVSVTNVVEAAVACDLCKNDHVAVFKPDFPPPKDWQPSDDQADGEGKETL